MGITPDDVPVGEDAGLTVPTLDEELHQREYLLTAEDRYAAYYAVRLAATFWSDDLDSMAFSMM